MVRSSRLFAASTARTRTRSFMPRTALSTIPSAKSSTFTKPFDGSGLPGADTLTATPLLNRKPETSPSSHSSAGTPSHEDRLSRPLHFPTQLGLSKSPERSVSQSLPSAIFSTLADTFSSFFSFLFGMPTPSSSYVTTPGLSAPTSTKLPKAAFPRATPSKDSPTWSSANFRFAGEPPSLSEARRTDGRWARGPERPAGRTPIAKPSSRGPAIHRQTAASTDDRQAPQGERLGSLGLGALACAISGSSGLEARGGLS
mmetsp:Transcript_53311/g.155324  ORF Transcript_53311/g.155324 Transcript_53311/m.155324 type:complete len:257 (+) Transcript_53311:137-907(+)